MQPPSSCVMEFVDSEIKQALWQGMDLHLEFAAAAVTRQRKDEAPVHGYLTGVTLVLLQCMPAATAALVGRLRSGGLRLQGQALQGRMPVPSLWSQWLCLELEPAQADRLLLQAHGLECRLHAEGAFRESLFC
nr:hypothetical protein [uncultured Rhodoferax sp.]